MQPISNVSFINQNSYIITSVIILMIMASILFRDGIRLLDITAITVVAATFFVSWLLVRPTQSTLTNIYEAGDIFTNEDMPILLEFQSEY